MTELTRRQALQSAGAGLAALALTPTAALAQKAAGYTLPPLPYPADALEPYIDKTTMEIHHDRHHLAYVNGANAALKDYPKLLERPVDELLAHIRDVPEKVRRQVINMAGGHSNHAIFWTIMGPRAGGQPTGALAKEIDARFKSFTNFRTTFTQAASGVFGSGWAWLVRNPKKELEIVQRFNQDSPFMTGLTPLLGIDVWEHAYYLKYKNLRGDYIKAWWNVVKWDAVADRAARSLKG